MKFLGPTRVQVQPGAEAEYVDSVGGFYFVPSTVTEVVSDTRMSMCHEHSILDGRIILDGIGGFL